MNWSAERMIIQSYTRRESIFVYSGAKGHASVPCTECNRIFMVDCETFKETSMPPRRRRDI